MIWLFRIWEINSCIDTSFGFGSTWHDDQVFFPIIKENMTDDMLLQFMSEWLHTAQSMSRENRTSIREKALLFLCILQPAIFA
jgi:hypothetical protein